MNFYFAYNDDYDSEVFLTQYKTMFKNNNDFKLEMNFYSETWKNTVLFLRNKKYEKVIKHFLNGNFLVIDTSYNTNNILFCPNNEEFLKNHLIEKAIKKMLSSFPYSINIKNQKKLYFNIMSKTIQFAYNGYNFKFHYQPATNKKKVVDMFLNFKKYVEYEINVKVANL